MYPLTLYNIIQSPLSCFSANLRDIFLAWKFDIFVNTVFKYLTCFCLIVKFNVKTSSNDFTCPEVRSHMTIASMQKGLTMSPLYIYEFRTLKFNLFYLESGERMSCGEPYLSSQFKPCPRQDFFMDTLRHNQPCSGELETLEKPDIGLGLYTRKHRQYQPSDSLYNTEPMFDISSLFPNKFI